MAYSRLVKLDTGPEGLQKNTIIVLPDAAEMWEVPDPQTYIFQLHRGMKFFDIAPVSAREVVADDVVYSFNRQIDEGVNKSQLGPISSIVAVDSHTVRIEITRPDVDQLGTFAETHNRIVAKEAVEVNGHLEDLPVIGSGAFMVDEWTSKQFLRYVRNPNYHLGDLPYFDAIEETFNRDRPIFLEALRLGRIHTSGVQGTGNLNPDEAAALADAVPEMVIFTRASSAVTGLYAHAQQPPTNDVRVRQALGMAIDRQAFINDLLQGNGQLGSGVRLPTARAELSQTELGTLLARDIEGARNLLSEANVTDWTPELLISARNPVPGEFVQAQLREIGVNATTDTYDVPRLTERIYNHEFEILLGGSGRGSTTNADLDVRFHSGGSINIPDIRDAQLDTWIEQQASETDEDTRIDLLKRIQRRIIELAVPSPIAAQNQIGAYRPELKDWAPGLGGDYWVSEIYDGAWFDSAAG